MTRTHGSKEFWLAGLGTEAATFAATVCQPEMLDLPVPTCPGWTGSDLVRHLAGVYQWVSGHFARGGTDRPEAAASPDGPADVSPLDWWHQEYTKLFSVLSLADPDQPVWNWAPQPKKAIFWHRRMAHETAIHRWDAQMATGLAEPVEATLAADGLTEAMDSYLAAGRRRHPETRPCVIALRATDLDEFWYVRLRPGGIALLDTDTLLDGDDLHERVTATGTASDLLLAVYGRIPFAALTVSGDQPLLDGLRVG